MIKRCHGQYTMTQKQRCSQMGGAFKQEMQDLFADAGFSSESSSLPEIDRSSKASAGHLKKVEEFIEEYTDDGLLDYCPPREHRYFPGFVRDNNLKDPYKLGLILKKHSVNLNRWQRIQDIASGKH